MRIYVSVEEYRDSLERLQEWLGKQQPRPENEGGRGETHSSSLIFSYQRIIRGFQDSVIMPLKCKNEVLDCFLTYLTSKDDILFGSMNEFLAALPYVIWLHRKKCWAITSTVSLPCNRQFQDCNTQQKILWHKEDQQIWL